MRTHGSWASSMSGGSSSSARASAPIAARASMARRRVIAWAQREELVGRRDGRLAPLVHGRYARRRVHGQERDQDVRAGGAVRSIACGLELDERLVGATSGREHGAGGTARTGVVR